MNKKTTSLAILVAASIALATMTAGAPLHGPLPAPTPDPTATPTAPPEGFQVNPSGVEVFSLPLSCFLGLLILIAALAAVLLAPRFLRTSGTANTSAEDSSQEPEV